MRLEVEPRTDSTNWASVLAPIAAVCLTLVIGAVLFSVLGHSPTAALYAFFVGPLLDPWSLHELAIKAAPLILIACGLAVCFRSMNWNIGAEGQFVAGALGASSVPILAPGWEGLLVLPCMALLGIVAGALWGAIPAVLKNRFGASEILSSLMLVYIAELVLDYLVRGPWRNPNGFNFPESAPFQSSAVLPELISQGELGGRAHWGVPIALVVAVGVWLLLAKTLRGYGLVVAGSSSKASRFAGFDAKRTTLFAFMLSGGLAGLAGMLEVSGAIGQLRPSISPGYGFTAIIVAFLARLNPLAIVVAAFVVALSFIGGEAAQVEIGVSERIARVFQGVLLFSVLAAESMTRYRIRIRFSRAREDDVAVIGVRASAAT